MEKILLVFLCILTGVVVIGIIISKIKDRAAENDTSENCYASTSLDAFFKALTKLTIIVGVATVAFGLYIDNKLFAWSVGIGTVICTFGCFVFRTLFSRINALGYMLDNMQEKLDDITDKLNRK